MGMSLISPAAGLAALETAVSGVTSSISIAPSAIAAVPFMWRQFVQRQLQRGADISMFEEFTAGLTAAGQAAAAAGPAEEQQAVSLDAVKAAVHSSVQEVLGSTVADDQPLMAAGLDSLGSVVRHSQLLHSVPLSPPPSLSVALCVSLSLSVSLCPPLCKHCKLSLQS
jgi:hypothetical protein